MKIYGDRLAGELKKKLAPVYIISGDEPLLMQEATDLVRNAARDAGYLERDLFHVEAGFNWTELTHSVSSMSLFGDQKMIDVRLNTAKPDDAGKKALQEVAEQAGDGTLMLVVMPRVDATTQKTKWFSAIEKLAVFVQVWPIEPRDLPGWLENRFKKAGLKPNREAVLMMAQRTEGNLLAAVQEIERLKLVAGDEVTAAMVEESVADSTRYDLFNLIDAALVGNGRRVVRMTRGMEAEGVEVMFLVTMLARELRSLCRMRDAMQQGASAHKVMQQNRIWKKREKPVHSCLERNSLEQLQEAQLSLGRVDRMVKGVEAGNPWRELTSLLLGLAGVNLV